MTTIPTPGASPGVSLPCGTFPADFDRLTFAGALRLVPWSRVDELCAPLWGVFVGEIVTALAQGKLPTMPPPSSAAHPPGSWGPPPPELYDIEGLDREARAWLRLCSQPIRSDDAAENLHCFLESIGDEPATYFLTPSGWCILLAHLYGNFGGWPLGEVLDMFAEWFGEGACDA